MNNLRGDVLAGASVVLLGGTIMLLFFVDFPDGSKDVLLVVIGVLTTIVKDVFSFEFSTSKSGERSAQAVLRIAEAAPTTSAAAVAAATGVLPLAPAVTPAPANPVTGVIPAAEVVSTQPTKETP